MLRSIRFKILMLFSGAFAVAMLLSTALAGQLIGQTFFPLKQEHTLFMLTATALSVGLSTLILAPILSLVLTRPLERLSAAMHQLGRSAFGDIPPRLDIESNDEIGELANSFNLMSDQLTESMCQADAHIQAMETKAHYDDLTQLPNRTYFLEQAQRRLDRASGDGRRMALLFLDLDRFKHINDTYGHRAGDKLLLQFAERLVSQVRAPDYPARLSGDEFVVLMDDIGRIDLVSRICRRIIDSMQYPFVVDGHQLIVGVSTGVAMFPEDGTDIEGLLKRADIAMYEAKQTGRNSYRFFKDALNLELEQRSCIEHQLRRVLSDGQFEIHLQPKYGTNGGEISGFEALARLPSSGQPALETSDIIAIAEDCGLIVPFGEEVLRQVCESLARLQRNGQSIPIAVNVSRIELADSHFSDRVLNMLRRHQVPAQLLELEVTEKIFYHDNQVELETLRYLCSAGVRIAIDHFGKGCSFLSRLQEVPVHRVKIDQSFVGDLPNNAKSMAVASSIIAIARNFRLDVIAGGVEHSEQLDALRVLGADEVQGFLLAPALPCAAAERLLACQG